MENEDDVKRERTYGEIQCPVNRVCAVLPVMVAVPELTHNSNNSCKRIAADNPKRLPRTGWYVDAH